jgi:hypothetical protein
MELVFPLDQQLLGHHRLDVRQPAGLDGSRRDQVVHPILGPGLEVAGELERGGEAPGGLR